MPSNAVLYSQALYPKYCHLNLAGCRGSTNTPRQQGSKISKKPSQQLGSSNQIKERQWGVVLKLKKKKKKTPQLITISLFCECQRNEERPPNPNHFTMDQEPHEWRQGVIIHQLLFNWMLLQPIFVCIITSYQKSGTAQHTHTQMSRWILKDVGCFNPRQRKMTRKI